MEEGRESYTVGAAEHELEPKDRLM